MGVSGGGGGGGVGVVVVGVGGGLGVGGGGDSNNRRRWWGPRNCGHVVLDRSASHWGVHWGEAPEELAVAE